MVEDITRDGAKKGEAGPRHAGLHYCRRYRNIVRYEPEFCATCPFGRGGDPDASDRETSI